ncbi:unknown [Acinetobacter sp. CAG:196]|nr:unknown [Acinetobacter sp. CAG:196]
MKQINNLNLELLTAVLGEPEKQSGDEYLWQCPLCKDTGRDNLKFNAVKGILWCFANESHAPQILKEILKKGRINLKPANADYNSYDRYKHIFSMQKQIEFKIYMQECNEKLLTIDILPSILLKKRGLNLSTARDVKLGVDMNKKRWVIPTFQYSTERANTILGFEYRPFNFSKDGLTREKGTPTGLAMINSYKPTMEVLAVVEGYFDGYALYQHLKEQKQIQYYHIVTPSNGIQSLLKHISQVDFSKYKRFCLYVDNDEEGNKVAEKIMAKYPIFERVTTTCGCKDLNEHYMKCIKGKG